MNRTNTYRVERWFLFMLTLTLFSACCIKEDLSVCPRPFQLSVKAVDADENDITASGAVKGVVMFVFDEKGTVMEAFELSAEQVKQKNPVQISVPYPGPKTLGCTAWGNLDASVDFASIKSVKQKQDLYVKLKSADGIAESPSELFSGSLDIPVEFGGIEQGQSHTVIIRHKVASVRIVARKLSPAVVPSVKFVLRESPDTYDADGTLTGGMVSYKPSFSFDAEGQWVTPIFNTFPDAGGKSYALDLYWDGKLKKTFTHGTDGTPLVPQLGRLLNIIIDVDAQVAVKVVVTPWGVVHQDVEY